MPGGQLCAFFTLSLPLAEFSLSVSVPVSIHLGTANAGLVLSRKQLPAAQGFPGSVMVRAVYSALPHFLCGVVCMTAVSWNSSTSEAACILQSVNRVLHCQPSNQPAR